MTYIYDSFGIRRKLSDLRFVEDIEKLKRKSASPWPVVERCLEYWAQKEPKAWKSFLINVKNTRDTRRNGGKSDRKKDWKHGGQFTYTLDLPEFVVYMLRMIYTPEELPMNQEFFDAFAERFPKFRVAEK